LFKALTHELAALDPAGDDYAAQFVQSLIEVGRLSGASDIHLQPIADGLQVRLRVDGVLHPVGQFSPGTSTNVVTRIKVLAGLLTYRMETPQEGRMQGADGTGNFEVRVSTFPTLHGERAVLRLFGGLERFQDITSLSLPADVTAELSAQLNETSGAILIVGPAGSGKTTTLYACLHELVHRGQSSRSIVTLEDPIEIAIPGVSQSQISAHQDFDLATAVRSVLRQDPEVIMVGEIRDAATASAVLQAALTGQLVLSSFHAGSAASAVRRLLDMGLEAYSLRSGLSAVVFQRLVRKLCECSEEAPTSADFLELPVQRARLPRGCDLCGGTGYRERMVLVESLPLHDKGVGDAILARSELAEIEHCALAAGMVDRMTRAVTAVEAGQTSPAEVRRVLGYGRLDLGGQE